MTDSDWEDITPTSLSDGDWEDITPNAKIPTPPSYQPEAQVPDNSVSGLAQQVAGPLLATMNGGAMNLGSEISAGGAAGLEWLQNKGANLGRSVIGQPQQPEQPFGEMYSNYYNSANDVANSFAERAPVASTALEVMGAIKGPAVKAIGALPRAATKLGRIGMGALTAGGLGFGYGAGGAEGDINKRAEAGVEQAPSAALLGGGLAAAGEVLAPVGKWASKKIKSLSTSYEQEALGVSAANIRSAMKQNIDYLDEYGNVVSPEKADSLSHSFIKKADIIKADGFRVSNNAETNLKNAEAAMEKIAAERNALLELADKPITKVPNEKLGWWGSLDDHVNTKNTISVNPLKAEPDWKPVEDLIDKYRRTQPVVAQNLEGKLAQVQTNWAISPKTLAESQAFKESTTEGAKSIWKGATDEQVADAQFKKKIYSVFQKQIENAFDSTVGTAQPELKGAIKALNTKYGAYKTLHETMINSYSKASTGAKIGRALNPLSYSGSLGYIGAATGNPVLMGIGAARAGAKLMPGTASEHLGVAKDVVDTTRAAKNITPKIIGALGATKSLPKIGFTKEAQAESPKTKSLEASTAKEIGIPEGKLTNLVHAIALTESRGNFKAQSPVGAQGVMQIMPAMQKAYGLKDPFDGKSNIATGLKIFADEYKRFKDIHLAVAAYNAGGPAIAKAIKKAGSSKFEILKKYLPKETQDYVPKVMAMMSQLQEQYGE